VKRDRTLDFIKASRGGQKSVLFSIIYKIVRMVSLFIYGVLLSQQAPVYILRLYKVD